MAGSGPGRAAARRATAAYPRELHRPVLGSLCDCGSHAWLSLALPLDPRIDGGCCRARRRHSVVAHHCYVAHHCCGDSLDRPCPPKRWHRVQSRVRHQNQSMVCRPASETNFEKPKTWGRMKSSGRCSRCLRAPMTARRTPRWPRWCRLTTSRRAFARTARRDGTADGAVGIPHKLKLQHKRPHTI